MANSTQTRHQDQSNTLDFQAPPPSPVEGTSHGLTIATVSLRVPNLVLPDSIFPKRNQIFQEVPVIDLQELNSIENGVEVSKIMRSSLAQTCCFQLIGHGISGDLIRSVLVGAAGVFSVAPEMNKAVATSPEWPFGFEERHEDDEGDEMSSEEFVWGREPGLELKMEGICPPGFYSNFSEKVESLSSDIAKVAEEILSIIPFHHHVSTRGVHRLNGSTCCISKHPHYAEKINNRAVDSIGYEVIRMMVMGSRHPHALCLHVCDDGCAEFHVYSKKLGLVSFTPQEHALIVTVGDQMQAWCGGGEHDKNGVIGRPIYEGKREDFSISLAFFYSPPGNGINIFSQRQQQQQKSISLTQQAFFAVFFILLLQFSLYLCKLCLYYMQKN
ncbi:non-haem dioxygenase in morphine synthesis N-terminal [Dionaea muscipula]